MARSQSGTATVAICANQKPHLLDRLNRVSRMRSSDKKQQDRRHTTVFFFKKIANFVEQPLLVAEVVFVAVISVIDG